MRALQASIILEIENIDSWVMVTDATVASVFSGKLKERFYGVHVEGAFSRRRHLYVRVIGGMPPD